MYEVSFFKSVSKPAHFAITPDASGAILPSSNEWQHWFSQMVYPEHATEVSELKKLEVGFKRDGYYTFP